MVTGTAFCGKSRQDSAICCVLRYFAPDRVSLTAARPRGALILLLPTTRPYSTHYLTLVTTAPSVPYLPVFAMRRDVRQRYATNAAWYNSASGADPRKDTQLTTGLGVTVERLDSIKRFIEQAIIEDSILDVSFRGRLHASVREQAVQKVTRHIVECENAPAAWVRKAMQNLLARVQSNMRKKTKVLLFRTRKHRHYPAIPRNAAAI